MAHDAETQQLIGSRLDELKALSFKDLERQPETDGKEVTVGGKKCSLTTFVQRLSPTEFLATVQVARNVVLGIGWHTERGLVFAANGTIREATVEELQNTGG